MVKLIKRKIIKMRLHKTTYSVIQKVENLDTGMMNIINSHNFHYLYVRKRNKSFPILKIEELNPDNLSTLEKILELRSAKIRSKILSLGQKRKIFLLFGNEFTKSWNNTFQGKRKIIEKKLVCIYIPGFKLCPGIYEIVQEVGKLN